jgi:type VII secretion protein EccE
MTERVTVRPRRRPGHLGPVHVMQLLVAEVAVVAVAATLTSAVPIVAATGAFSAVAVLLALGRRHHRWWLEHRLLRWRYRRRARRSGAGERDDPRLVGMRLLAPGLTVQNVRAADGAFVGVGRDDAGWYAVISVDPTAPLGDDPGRRVQLDGLVTALADTEQPGVMVQAVTHTVPAPSLDAHPASPAGHSYRQLLAEAGTVPTDRASWIAVRLDAHSLAAAGADADAAPGAVAALARRAAKSLPRAGLAYHVLDAEGLLGVLARSCDLEPTGAAPEAREDWTAWHSHRLAHRSFWVRRWPADGRAAELLDALGTAPASMTSVALILASDPAQDGPGDGGTVDLRCLVRVAAPADALDAVCKTVRRRAAEIRADLLPLDGEQAPAVYASAPTGGGPR